MTYRKYQTPSQEVFYMKEEDVLAAATKEELAEIDRIKSLNKQKAELILEFNDLYSRAFKLLGFDYKTYRKKNYNRMVEQLSYIVTGKDLLHPITKRLEKEVAQRWKREDEAKEAERIKAENELQQDAINWLIERGLKLGEDFNILDAVGKANELAAEDEIKRKMATTEYHGFNGQNCDGPCAGWDGESRRCECGNRRVGWVRGYGHSFKAPHVYGEAW